MIDFEMWEGETAESLVARNSPMLLATLLLRTVTDAREILHIYNSDLDELRSALDHAQRIGVRVLVARRHGRRMIRISDVIDTEEH